MLKPTKVGLHRDTLRKLDAGDLGRVRGAIYNSSYGACTCSSSGSQFGGFGASRCYKSCDGYVEE